jgi:hypothetical protein
MQIKIKIICANSIVIQKIKETGAAPSMAVELAASLNIILCLHFNSKKLLHNYLIHNYYL